MAWLTALVAKASTAGRYGGIATARRRRHYSRLRIGWEMLRQRRTVVSPRDLWRAFEHPPSWALQELEISG